VRAEAFLSSLAERRIHVILDGDGLVVEPASRLTNDDRRIIRQHKPELLVCLRQHQEGPGIGGLARANGSKPLPTPGSPAYSIVETCQLYGVVLRIDSDGTLGVGKAGARADEPPNLGPNY
jgi:hypothetical protein